MPPGGERAGDYWHAAIPVNNRDAAVSQDAKVVAVLKNQGPDGKDIVGEYSAGRFFVPKTPELFTYDADGNLLTDGHFTYSWDTENRLVAAETQSGIGVSPMKRLEFTYDAQGRRISKKVWNVAAGVPPALVSATAYLYDGWNLIAELDLMNAQAVVRSHIWGLDLSGSLQGAGGVGGLLGSFSTAPNTPAAAFPAYDGNGNVVSLVDATGSAVASYEYDPFGRTLIQTGTAADSNLFRFSTKYFDAEIGLYYYGFRYYTPETGTWLSRDPIEENGEINLYGFAGNDGVDLYDMFGLFGAGQAVLTSGELDVIRNDYDTMSDYVWRFRPRFSFAKPRSNGIGFSLDFDVKFGRFVPNPNKPNTFGEYLAKKVAKGHSDFYGSISLTTGDHLFNYNIEDDSFWTSPVNPMGINHHFRTKKKDIEDDLDNAIKGNLGSMFWQKMSFGKFGKATCPCDKDRFERLLHQLQDHHGHVKPGYTGHWWGILPLYPVAFPLSAIGIDIPGSGHPIISWRTNPDNDGQNTVTRWVDAETDTTIWVGRWKSTCPQTFPNGGTKP